jgi:hypothetical protein
MKIGVNYMKNNKIVNVFIASIILFHSRNNTFVYAQEFQETTQKNYSLEVYSGSGRMGYADGIKKEASFMTPYGITIDSSGNLLVADIDANMIRKIGRSKVETISGSVVATNSSGIPIGTNGINLQKTTLNRPQYIAKAKNGDIFITSEASNEIRVIKSNSGKNHVFSGKIEQGYENGTSKKSLFNSPTGIVVDKYLNVYVSDTLNNCIRVIDKNGNSKLFAGIPSEEGGYADGESNLAEFREPTGLALASDGSLYVADSGNGMVRKITEGRVTTVAGMLTELDETTDTLIGGFKDGEATEAMFTSPRGLTVGANNVLYVADTGNNRIRKIENGIVTTIAGNGESSNILTEIALESSFYRPIDVAYYNNKVYVTDSINHSIKVIK